VKEERRNAMVGVVSVEKYSIGRTIMQCGG
jgi:hypothetical protein